MHTNLRIQQAALRKESIHKCWFSAIVQTLPVEHMTVFLTNLSTTITAHSKCSSNINIYVQNGISYVCITTQRNRARQSTWLCVCVSVIYSDYSLCCRYQPHHCQPPSISPHIHSSTPGHQLTNTIQYNTILKLLGVC